MSHRRWMPHRLQVARRSVQILAVGVMLLVPALARYENYLSARELDKVLEKWDGTLQGTTLRAIDHTLRALPDGERERAGVMARHHTRVLEYGQVLRGGPWSIAVGPVSATDPLAVVESWVARGHADRVLWLGLLVPLGIALLLGRVFCSWVCPMGLLLEITDHLRKPLRWLELRPRDIHAWRPTKYVVLGAGLLLTAVLSMPLLGLVYPPAVLGREAHDLVFGMFDRAEAGRFGLWLGGLTWMSGILLAIVLVEVAVSRRWWCRYVCPGGALYTLLGRWRVVRVRLVESACTTCGACNRACHLGLRPMQAQMGIDCDNCGQCISSCRDGALHYGLGWNDVAAPKRPAPDRRRALRAAGLVLAGLLLLPASDARAHHILGIPHYAYDERYPQVPILTYRVDVGSFEIELTGYPGIPEPEQPCFINLYVRRLADAAPFDGAVQLVVHEDRFIGNDPVVYGPVEAGLDESVYKFYPQFPREANYRLIIHFEGDGQPYTIELPMVVGEPGSPWRVLGGVGLGLVVFLVVIRALRIKRQRAAGRKAGRRVRTVRDVESDAAVSAVAVSGTTRSPNPKLVSAEPSSASSLAASARRAS